MADSQAAVPAACGLIGTWRFVELVDWDSTGQASYAFGPHPAGYLIYTETGQVSVHLAGTSPPSLSSAAAAGIPQASYFGTFETDSACGTVIHHVEGGTDPGEIGTSQARPFHLVADTLILGDGHTWRRTLVRVTR